MFQNKLSLHATTCLLCGWRVTFHMSIASEFSDEACNCCTPLFFICQSLCPPSPFEFFLKLPIQWRKTSEGLVCLGSWQNITLDGKKFEYGFCPKSKMTFSKTKTFFHLNNFFISSSKYYDIEEMHNIEIPHNNKSLSLFHINACSLNISWVALKKTLK